MNDLVKVDISFSEGIHMVSRLNKEGFIPRRDFKWTEEGIFVDDQLTIKFTLWCKPDLVVYYRLKYETS